MSGDPAAAACADKVMFSVLRRPPPTCAIEAFSDASTD